MSWRGAAENACPWWKQTRGGGGEDLQHNGIRRRRKTLNPVEFSLTPSTHEANTLAMHFIS
jgi:hypothetical protein